MSVQSFRWRYLLADKAINIGGTTLTLDDEGFVIETVGQALDARLHRNKNFAYVALNNDALWEKRLSDSSARVESARENCRQVERDAIRANDFLRACEEQHRSLEAERARYQAAIEGAGATGATPTEPAEPPKAEASDSKGADKASDKPSGKKG